MTQSNYSITEIVNADIIDESHNTLLCRFSDGSVSSISRENPYARFCNSSLDPSTPISASGRALLERTDIDRGGTGAPIELEIEAGMENATLSSHGTTVSLTGSDLADALDIVIRNRGYQQSDSETTSAFGAGSKLAEINTSAQSSLINLDLPKADASRLFNIFERIMENRVRPDLLEDISDYFGSMDIRTQDNGWIIEGTYLLTYDGAEVYFTEDKDIYQRSGSSVRDVTETKQVFGIDVDTDPLKEITIGTKTEVFSEVEQRFLTICRILTSPSRYLGFDSFEMEVYGAIRDATKDRTESSIHRLADTATFSHFIDPKTGLLHKHEVDKHLAYTTFDLNYWVIRDLEYSSFDHAGVAELAWREDELRASSRDVFQDVPNDDDARWSRIQNVTENAPCPPHVYNKLDSLYGQR